MEAFQVRSKSQPGHFHTVHIDGAESDCTCTAAAYGKPCEHVRIARELMAAENVHATIYEAMAAAYHDCGYVQKTQTQGLKYRFAGEQAMIEAIRPVLLKHGIFVHPMEIKEVRRETYQTSGGSTMQLVGLSVVYQFAHSSGTGITVAAYGEGADVGDKAAPKAMTGAYKYALRQAFCIETGDDPDEYPSEAQERRQESPRPAPRHPADNGPAAERPLDGPPDWNAFWTWARAKGHTTESLGAFINRPSMAGATEADCREVVRLVEEVVPA